MIERWSKPNGYRSVMAISLPLVASMGSITLMQFTDRIFLSNYSVDSISAALPAGLASFTCFSIFLGAVHYTNAFVAQYTGANALDRVGASVWQGIYFSIFAALLVASFVFISGHLFDMIGHSPHVRALEIKYFNILILGAVFPLLGSAMACFYTGRGLTRVVMFIHMAGAMVNIPLDYCLINGIGPFPEMGITGAAIATVASSAVIVLILGFFFFSSYNRSRFGTWNNRGFDKELFSRLMRYGLPSGIQFFLEIFGFTFFIQMLGRLGDLEMAASNIVLSLESLAFLPMVGFHIGNATLVGQAIGRGYPEDGVYATTSSLHVTLVYMAIISFFFVFLPEPLLYLFKARNYSPEQFAAIMDLGIVLLRFVAVFCFFDALNLIYSGAIKGAGDTRFIMWTIAALSLGGMIIPVYIAIEFLGAGIYTAWTIAAFYACLLGMAFMLRYRHGKWKKMRIIESSPVSS
ncbi:MAG: MATE family efflux transporter [Proteobacteria bacterium]|nr:MATE family efflux transporter [Pseudomonadota bacterium]